MNNSEELERFASFGMSAWRRRNAVQLSACFKQSRHDGQLVSDVEV